MHSSVLEEGVTSCGPVRRPWASFSLNTAIQTGDEMGGRNVCLLFFELG